MGLVFGSVSSDWFLSVNYLVLISKPGLGNFFVLKSCFSSVENLNFSSLTLLWHVFIEDGVHSFIFSHRNFLELLLLNDIIDGSWLLSVSGFLDSSVEDLILGRKSDFLFILVEGVCHILADSPWHLSVSDFLLYIVRNIIDGLVFSVRHFISDCHILEGVVFMKIIIL